MLDIAMLVSTTWTVLQPYLPLIATAAVQETGKRALGEVWEAVKKKFDKKEHTQKILVDLLKTRTTKRCRGPSNMLCRGSWKKMNRFVWTWRNCSRQQAQLTMPR